MCVCVYVCMCENIHIVVEERVLARRLRKSGSLQTECLYFNIDVNEWVTVGIRCARVRACAGANESLHTHIHTCIMQNGEILCTTYRARLIQGYSGTPRKR